MKNNYYFKRQRVGLLVLGGFMTLLIAFSMTPAFAGIVASIINVSNTATTGSVIMEETSGTITCTTDGATGNTANCSTINKYGGTDTPLVPGGSSTPVSLSIKNVGTIPATSFTVEGGTCSSTPTDSYNLCDKINVKIMSGATTIYNGTATAFATAGEINILTLLSLSNVDVSDADTDNSIPFTVQVTLSSDADQNYQGKEISQPITWKFGA